LFIVAVIDGALLESLFVIVGFLYIDAKTSCRWWQSLLASVGKVFVWD